MLVAASPPSLLELGCIELLWFIVVFIVCWPNTALGLHLINLLIDCCVVPSACPCLEVACFRGALALFI